MVGIFDVDKAYGVKKIGDLTYIGNEPLPKVEKASKNVYGGSLAGQAILVAMKSLPVGYTPHSIHSYFVKIATDHVPITWEVEEISNGRSFCNRSVKGYQDNVLKFYANISLTSKNSHRKFKQQYEEYVKKQEEKNQNEDDDDDDDDDSPVVPKPFQFQTPYHDWFTKHKQEDIEWDYRGSNIEVAHKIIPKLLELESSEEEEKVPIAERRLSYYVKWGTSEKVILEDKAYNFVGLCTLSDSLFLTRHARVLRVRDVDLSDMVHYYFTSLDHIIYFHDDDFDPTQWMGFSFRAARLINNRTVVEGEMYNEKGVHVATVIQEGMVLLNGLEKGAKL